MEENPIKKVAQPGGKVKPKRRRSARGLNFLLFIGIIISIGLFSWAEQQRRAATSRLEETQQQLEEIRESTQRSGQEVADQVLGEVQKLFSLPTDPAPTVATIIDVERLRETSPFYDKANNGDHLIITEDRAILYNPDQKIIIDVVPVSREEEPAETPAEEASATTQPTSEAAAPTQIPSEATDTTPADATQDQVDSAPANATQP